MYKFPMYPGKSIACHFLLAVLFFVQGLNAQNLKSPEHDRLVKRYTNKNIAGFSSIHRYYLFFKNQKTQPSIKAVRILNENITVIQVNHKNEYDSLFKIGGLVAANDSWKLSPYLERSFHSDRKTKKKYIVTGLSIDELLKIIKEKHKTIEIVNINRPSHSLVVKTTHAYIEEQLLKLKEIIFIDLAFEAREETPIIGYDRSLHGINAVDYLLPGANGKNIVAGVKEQKMDENDMDLWKRVLPSPIAASTSTYHATVIATIIGGAGNSFYDGRGLAWGCTFFPSSFSNLFADDATVLRAGRVSVQNHSYGTIPQQFYGAEAVSYDLLTWSDKNFVAVFSAGNQGEVAATEGRYANLPGFANITGNFKMAKNVITVGAIDNKENIPPQSSAGPLYDGRIAPQLSALGPSGTSDAAAVVSGTAAVMQQVYRDSNNALPPASLTKAILYNTSEDIYTPGIDYKTGYGLLDSYAAVKAIQQKMYEGGSVTNGQLWTKNISVPSNAAEIKITLAWTDTVSQVNNSKALNNDLDLELLQTSAGVIFQPWVLSTAAHADSLAKQPTRKRDSLHTAEQVSIKLPVAGNYEVRVKGTSVTSSSMPFNIALKIDTLNTFRFTNPLHASDVNRAESANVTIRWKTFVADSNQTASLFISYNNGGSWQLLGQPRLTAKKFVWPIKDTNSIARLKMQTSFGEFLSNEFIIAKLTKLKVDFICADSFRLSWNKHVYANGYRLFTLTDSPYLKPILVVSDSFIVLQRSAYPSRVYAVEPILSVGIPAARSMAFDISLQGANCFYKALNYNLLDDNKLNLLLELSVATYADSIFFEKVTGSGELLQIFGAAKANDATVFYSQLVNELSPGVTHIRARIKLKSGAIVYTDIISVVTSGPQYIYFYPNPVQRNSILSYSLRQGVSTSAKLQLYDVYGRLIKNYSSMPGTLNLSHIMPGVLFYKLFTGENKLLETGKFIVL